MPADTIAREIRNGNEEAWQGFYMAYYPRVLAWLHKVMNSDVYAEDIAQDVFYKLWIHREKIDPSQSLEAWLFTILRNTTATFFKKQLKERHSFRSVPATGSHDPVREAIDHKAAYTAYEHALQQMPPASRKYFLLHREQGLTHRQIAEQEGLALRMVEFHISRALKFLRKSLTALFLFLAALLLLTIW